MSRPLRVLLVEDSESDAKLLVRCLEKAGYAVDFARVQTAPDLKAALESARWDVVISDWAMPRFSALGAIEAVMGAGLDLPVIVVSGTIGEETAVDAMRTGARDFVLKSRLARLAPAVEREVREAHARASRQRAEEALRVSEARFARLAESGMIGIASTRTDGRVHDANDAFLAMTGYSRDDLAAGRIDWAAVTPAEWAAVDVAATRELATTGVAAPWERELVRKDGSRLPVLVGVAMVDGESLVAFAIDLSERRRVEHALHESEEQLRTAQKMEAIGILAGGVAHDFNNLLSVILSYVQLALADLPPNEPLREDLSEVEQAALRASALTRQLLAFSRRQVLQPAVLDLNEVLVGMKKMLLRLIGEDVELTLTTADDLPPVLVDPGQIEQVVMNLVVNARDAMPTGGRLTIETAREVLDASFVAQHLGTRPGPHVRLTVRDTGVGMDEATRVRIFEPFFTTKGVGKGTGLGLSTVLGIVQQSGGSIWVSSEVGRGTAFDLYFAPAEAEGRAAEGVARVASPRGTETILVTEDDEALRAVVCTILRRYGYHVLEAQTAGDAILLCETHVGEIHLLLTDVVMPRLSGRELAARVRGPRPDMAVLYMSGYTDDAVVRHGVRDSEVWFLQKPLTPETLGRKVREALAHPPPTRRHPKS